MSVIEQTMLVLVSAGNNNNKFYKVELHEDGSVIKTYGRVGAKGAVVKSAGGKSAYDSIIRQKTRKGYKPTEIEASTVDSGHADNAKVLEIARKTLIQAGSSELERLVDLLVAKNNHEIVEASGGKMEVSSDGMITTPLGLVSRPSLSQARILLDKIEPLRHSRTRTGLLDDYLTLVPQRVPSRAGWDEKFLVSAEEVASQREFLKQLDESLTLHEERMNAAIAAAKSSGNTEEELAEKYADLFRFKVSLLDDAKEFNRIERFFEKGRNRMHSSSNMNLNRVYVLDDAPGRQRFEAKAKDIGNVMELWHGTRVWNVLSILRQGLLVDAEKSIKTVNMNGKMFGVPSLYTSDQATKSLSYSEGFWDRGQRHDNCFMFLTDVAMGRTHKAKRGVSYSGGHIQRSGEWDSIFAEGGKSDVRNNEMIIWNSDQISLKYLCEFER